MQFLLIQMGAKVFDTDVAIEDSFENVTML